MPLVKQGLWNTGTRWNQELVCLYRSFPYLYGNLMRTRCSAQNSDVSVFFGFFVHCMSHKKIITLILESLRRSNFTPVMFDVYLTSIFSFTTFSPLRNENIGNNIWYFKLSEFLLAPVTSTLRCHSNSNCAYVAENSFGIIFDSLLCYTIVICKTCLKRIHENKPFLRTFQTALVKGLQMQNAY